MPRLIIAEKPSVARDIARVIGAKSKQRGYLASATDWVSWCVGHLVEFVEPHSYDPRFKSWRMAHLPIIPERFQLRTIAQSAAPLGITVHDHIIIGKDGHASMKALQLF